MAELQEGDRRINPLANIKCVCRKFILQRIPMLKLILSSPLRLFDTAKSKGKSLYAAAPMARYSKVNFAD
jgi:hypothetical protein